MSRYLIIEFDDDAQAEALRAQINTATAKGKRFRVVGLFARPKRWCKCIIDKTDMRGRVVRGGKYGWWVCTECRHPRLGGHQAKNLLPREGIDTSPIIQGIDQLSNAPKILDYVVAVDSLSLTVFPRR